VQVTGDVYISTGAGAADIDMLEGSARFLNIKTGSGLADINIATYDIDHSLLITNGNGAGPDVITLDGLTVGAQNDGRTMGKDISIIGASSTTLSLTNSTVQGFINVQTMTGTQEFNFDNVQVNGSISVRNGATGNVTFNGSNLDVGNTFALITGRGMHEINLGQAGPVATARGLAIRSDGGAVVTMDDTTVGLDLSVTLGNTNGLSQMFIGTSLPLFVNRNASFRTGIGDTEITIGALETGGNLVVQSRSGDDLWTIGGIAGIGDLIVGRFTIISTGLGTDDVQLGTDAGAISYFTGAFNLNLGPGDDSVTVGEGVTGDAFFEPYNFVFDGSLGDNSITVTGAVAFDPFDPAIRKRIRNFGTNIFT
jgi:hypothetical protein